MKATVYLAMKEQGLSKSDLDRRMGLDEKDARRILGPKHSTRAPPWKAPCTRWKAG